jgi:tRNA uridine 5-carbamoylmethylation protein Kti12
MKKLILMRGIPSSGKSSLANELCQEYESKGLRCQIHSTDKFHYIFDFEEEKYVYKFDLEKCPLYHKINLQNAIHAMTLEINVIIVDNTNITWKEMIRYILVALANDYEIELLEPETSWKYDVDKCFELSKNTHNVPHETIKRMKYRWESTSVCIKRLNIWKTMMEL